MYDRDAWIEEQLAQEFDQEHHVPLIGAGGQTISPDTTEAQHAAQRQAEIDALRDAHARTR